MQDKIATRDETHEKPAATEYPVHRLIRRRWSSRAFSTEAVSPAVIGTLLEAARWAPSSMNEQPWRFLVGRRNDKVYKKLMASLSDKNREWAQNAPVLLLAVAKLKLEHGGRANGYALYDTGQAVAQLTLQATAVGINIHQMGGFSKERARSGLNIPDGYKPATVIALGYPGEAETLPEWVQQREESPRDRHPLGEIAYYGGWGRPITPWLKQAHEDWNRSNGGINDN